jgi:hypothetical protein
MAHIGTVRGISVEATRDEAGGVKFFVQTVPPRELSADEIAKLMETNNLQFVSMAAAELMAEFVRRRRAPTQGFALPRLVSEPVSEPESLSSKPPLEGEAVLELFSPMKSVDRTALGAVVGPNVVEDVSPAPITDFNRLTFQICTAVFALWMLFLALFGLIGGNRVPLLSSIYHASDATQTPASGTNTISAAP